MQIPTIRRSNRKASYERFRGYATDAWQAAAIDTLDPAYVEIDHEPIVAVQGRDFHVNAASFVQDLHRLARLFTDASADRAAGYIARTSRAGLPDDHVAFVFFRVPASEARGTADINHRRTSDSAGQPDPAVTDPALAQAWAEHRYYAWFCRKTDEGQILHPRGYGQNCPDCQGQAAETLPEVPDPDFVHIFYSTQEPTA